MHSKLFITLSAVTLIGTSVAAYGEVITDTWAWYSRDGKISLPTPGQIPQADCLETICEHGCVEKNGEYGTCCPGDGQCRVESGEDVDLCCEDGTPCIQGMCGCPTGTTEYIGIGNIKACCNNTTHKLFSIEGTTSQACCLNGTFWNATQQKCVECLVISDCGEGQICTSEYKCKDLEGLKCTSNKECNGGSETGDYYCNNGGCGISGCQKIPADSMGHKAPYTWSHAEMGSSSADNWCKAQGLSLARWYHPSTVPNYIEWNSVRAWRRGRKFYNTYLATDPDYNGSNGCEFHLADGVYLYVCGGWQYADNKWPACRYALCYGN